MVARPRSSRVWGFTRAELVTAIVGVGSILIGGGSLAVSWLAYQNAKDTHDIKVAIANLATLAEQAKSQTKAISEQTAAIKKSSDAQIAAAKAQVLAADSTRAATKPDLRVSQIQDRLSSDEPGVRHSSTFVIYFMNSGGTTLQIGTIEASWFIGRELPRTRPTGLHLNSETVGRPLPKDRVWGVTSTVEMSPAELAALRNGSVHLFVFGDVTYVAADNSNHKYCYAERLGFRNESVDGTFAPVGTSDYLTGHGCTDH